MGQSTQKPEFTPFGALFEPIGWINGKAVWPILGGAPEDGDSETGAQGGTDEAGQSTGNDGNDDGNGASGQSAGTDSDSQRPVTREEFDRLRTQLSAADKNKSAAEKALADANARIKEFEDKDRSELEKAQNEAEEAKKDRDSARETLRTLSLEQAFRDASDTAEFVWHNNKVAMRELDESLYKLEDDGSITGMDKAVKALAKDHAYLLKKEQQSGGSRTGGSYNNGSGGGTGGTTDKKALSGKYPALRGRGGNQ